VKFVTNCPELLSNLDDGLKVAATVKEIETLDQSVLGVKWSIHDDTFRFSCSVSQGDVSRRQMLRFIAAFFDPLGLISPIVVRGRFLLQRATSLKLGWDDPLPADLQQEWDCWVDDLRRLHLLCFPRCIRPIKMQ
jgi:hypothetical protein